MYLEIATSWTIGIGALLLIAWTSQAVYSINRWLHDIPSYKGDTLLVAKLGEGIEDFLTLGIPGDVLTFYLGTIFWGSLAAMAGFAWPVSTPVALLVSGLFALRSFIRFKTKVNKALKLDK